MQCQTLFEFYRRLTAGGRKGDDHRADAMVAAWCAAQGWSRRWVANLFDAPGDDLEFVAGPATYPWPEHVPA